jgi:hypothetical protein
MKIYLLFIIMLFSSLYTMAQKQGNFSIKLNNKVVIGKQAIPETEAVKASIKKASILKKNILTINYMERSAQADWHIEFIITDENGTELSRAEQKTVSGVFAITLPKDMKASVITIQTLSKPNDASQAAVMRLRTFPLATITIN